MATNDIDVIFPLGEAPRAHRSRGGGGCSSAVSVGSEGSSQRRRRRKTGPRSESSIDSKDSSQSLPVGAPRGICKTEGSIPKDPSLRVVFKGEQHYPPSPQRLPPQRGASEARREPSDEEATQAWLAKQEATERQREGGAASAGPVPQAMSRGTAAVRSPTSTAMAELSQQGVVGPAKPASDLRSGETGSDERSEAAYSLDGFVVGDQVVPNPLQGAVGQAPEGWADTAAAKPVATAKVADEGFPRWFHQYQAWLKPRDGTFAPMLLLLSWHGCACGCCGCCGCICGHSLGEKPPPVENKIIPTTSSV